MADRLTQLQDCLDDLATQMFASLRYIQTHHSFAAVEGQPDLDPYSEANKKSSAKDGDGKGDAGGDDQNPAVAVIKDEAPEPDPPEVFQASLRELARDLILKEQQIEYLITVLPGIGNSERDQTTRIDTLEAELRRIEDERRAATNEKEKMLGMLSELAANCKRVY